MKASLKNKLIKCFKIFLMALGVAAVVYVPVIYRFIVDGIIYSGNGDGFKQMMPFQRFLYDRFTHFSSLYDVSMGLGGDYYMDLAYYYSTSVVMYLNFIMIAIGQWLFHLNPSEISFWPANQIFTGFFKCMITFFVTYGMFREFHLKGKYRFIGAFLYSASSVLYYFNFTWSFFGDILIFLPLSIWGIERFFKQRKIGVFILAISLTLYSNFYFSYYETIALTAYLAYRIIFKHPEDIVSRWQKLYLLIPATMFSFCIASFGFVSGVRSFINNDRTLNQIFISPIIDFSQKYHIFTNGFYITLTFIVIVALCSFKLYRHYYFKMFAILTWCILIGSLSLYFDSFFNGFSAPQRRWVYLLALTTSGLIALWLKHFSELTLKDYVKALSPLVILAIFTVLFSRGAMWWMIVGVLILILLGYMSWRAHSHSRWLMTVVISLFVLQQFVLLMNYHTNNIAKYQSTMKDIDAPKYHSQPLQQKINQITSHQQDLDRIDYMDSYAVNAGMIYKFNGVSLYSSIFDGNILEYYDKTMQINMEYDSNSTYRMLGNRANLYALWGVTDRIKKAPDQNLPYGLKVEDTIKDGATTWEHARNTVHYPAAHLTSRIYDPKSLKSPIDREHAMLLGVVSDQHKANSQLKTNPNLISQATITERDAKILGNQLNVKETDGGVTIKLPESVQKQFKDYYIELDVELLQPNQPHYSDVNDFHQRRSNLDYQYRRFVTPVTVRVPVKDAIHIKLKKGTYRFQVNGIYGENYQTLRNAQHAVDPVQVTRHRDRLDVTMSPKKDSYLVLPIPYREGLYAKVNGEKRAITQGNGIQSIVPVHKGEHKLTVHYAIPYWPVLLILTIIGIFGAYLYRRWLIKSKLCK
ncbi:YfhO family protein [Staphylococcus agnetis]|uniref:YfhO family protein n=1 Tax=Staphylococcus agnetis TaxID=985762 RepID=UPI001F54690A|nr:YfhO family protein [Staphylococcus agnetis]